MTRTIVILLLSLTLSFAVVPAFADPALNSTYIGGTIKDEHIEVAFDSDDNVFVLGFSKSNAFLDPSITGYQTTPQGNGDILIVKLTNDLSTILAATYLGGAEEEDWASIAVDSSGSVFVTGETVSTDFPGMNGTSPQQTYTDRGDVFISKLSNDLQTLHQSTYFGNADGYEESFEIHINTIGGNEEVYLLGESNSTGTLLFSTNGFQPTHNGLEEGTFVAKLSNDLRTVIDSTYFGSSMYDDSPSFVIHPSGNIYVEVNTNGTAATWPTEVSSVLTNSFTGTPTNMVRDDFNDNLGHRNNADHVINQDILIASISNDLSTVNAATYLGSSALDAWADFVIHTDGNLYFTLETYGVDYPITSGVLYEEHGLSCDVTGTITDGSGNVCNTPVDSDYTYLGATERNSVVTVMSENLSTIVSSTYIGIPYANDPSDINVDADGNVYITGQKTQDQEYSFLGGAIQEVIGGGSTDGYIVKLNNDLTEWIQTTYIGGSGTEDNPDVYFDNSNQLFIATDTRSSDYPGTENGAQSTKGGGLDLVISRIANDLLTLTPVVVEVQEEKKKGGGGCSNCTPPTMGVNDHNRQIVENGFAIGDNFVDVEFFKQNYPTQTFETNEPITVIMHFYEDTVAENISHVEFNFNEQKTIGIDWDKDSEFTLKDKENILNNVVVKSKEINNQEMEMLFTFEITKPIEFESVNAYFWDTKRNSAINHFENTPLVIVAGKEPVVEEIAEPEIVIIPSATPEPPALPEPEPTSVPEPQAEIIESNCKDGFVEMFKIFSEKSVCVTPDTSSKLYLRGYADYTI